MKTDFDIAAKYYDNAFTYTKIGKAQRQVVYKYLDATIKNQSKLSILELNCGTGEDANYLGQLEHSVLATDISKEMITVAKSKSDVPNLDFKTLDIKTITGTTFNTKFDLIFSNFGGFNCLDSKAIEAFFTLAKDLLNPKGKIILVIMPKHCVWEQLYFSLKGQIKKVKRRKTTTYTLANVEGINVKTWYYNPSDIVVLLKDTFKLKTVKPIGLFIPPSYLNNSILTKGFIFNFLKWLDRNFTASYWAKYADHFYIEVELK